MLRHLFTTLILLCFSQISLAAYVQDRDLISLHYDHAPDRDDGHATVAALAVVNARGIQPHVVSGAYGARNRNQYQPAAETVMRRTWGTNWVNAHANWQSAVAATATRWLNTLSNGGDIWVAEGGQSDFTADVVRRIRSSNPGINTNNRIHVVQHSTWNENQADSGDLNYTRSNTEYIKIADGNGVNATADLNQRSASFVQLARASQFGDAWNAAFSYLNPNNKLDFSDTVELLHILEIGTDQVATVNDFGALYLSQTPPTTPSASPTVWSDSYSVDGQCHCDTDFDHGLGSMSVDTPTGQRRIREVCADITTRFGTGRFDGRVYYNTVQCGHGPANNAPDEAACPGIPRGANNYTGERCQQTGATWNLDVLYPEPAPPPVTPQTPLPPQPEPPQPEPQEPEPLPPVAQEPSAAPIDLLTLFPACSSAAADDNGDGYGWENNQTCVVISPTANAPQAPGSQDQTPALVETPAPVNNPLINFPICSAAIVDADGDGYAWENNQTCVVASGNSQTVSTPTQQAPIDNPLVNFPVCSSTIADDNGDGYAWENNQTCVVPTGNSQAVSTPTQQAPIDNPLVNFPVCSSSTVDDNGDGYAWENNQTCVVPTGVAQAPVTPAPQAPIDNPLVNFPVCSSTTADDNGDGYAWENNQTCVVSQTVLTPPVVNTPVVNNDSVTLLNFPQCSSSAVDPEGDGYAWENNQTCAMPTLSTPASLVTFPICSNAVTDENNDGYAWENNRTCLIVAQ